MIKILCVGKIKESYLNDFILDYKKRISKYHSIQIIEVKDSDSLEKERDLLFRYIGPKDYVIPLVIEGKSITSEDLAFKLDKIFIEYPVITFVIGSSLGLHEEIKKRGNFLLSFSTLTFPHGVFRGILLEQVYRAFKILNHESYHK